MMRSVAGVIGLLSLHQGAQATGVCEKARIPLRTVELGDGSSVCVVPFCGNEDQKTTPEGTITCMKCDQTPWVKDGSEYWEKTDVCPLALGECVDGQCCPQRGENTWYHQNFKKDWNGIATWTGVSVTYYAGSAACGGQVEDAEKYLRDQGTGIDGIAAVPSVMYGSWIRNMRAGSQACYANNNICYKVTSWRDEEFTVAVWGKCGGYTQCSGHTETGLENFFWESSSRIEGTDWYDANKCINVEEVQIHAGITPDCKPISPPEGKDTKGTTCCPYPCQLHVDHCGSNDHPHLDLSGYVHRRVCAKEGDNVDDPNLIVDNCTLKKIEPVLCPWNPPKNAAFKDWTPKLNKLCVEGDPECAPIHEPYPEPTCFDGGDPAPPVPEPDTTQAPPPPPVEGPVDCDSVTSHTLPALEEACATSVCTLLCEKLKPHCAGAMDESYCINEGIELALCPVSKGCGCSYDH